MKDLPRVVTVFILIFVLILANTKSKSVRATIPNDVVEYLGLDVGDVIEWETFKESGKHYAKIRKLH